MSVQYTQNVDNPTIGDPITTLPVDQTPPSNMEVQIIDTLFKKHRTTMDIIAEEFKDSLLVVVLVIFSSTPQVEAFITKLLPITTKSIYILITIRGLLVAVLYWLIKHFYLSRKNS